VRQFVPSSGVVKEFRDFVARGNVIDLAVGVVIGAAFGKIVTSFVIDFSSLFYTLERSKGIPASLAEAKTRGIPVIAWGQFINDIIGFFIVAAAVFVLVKQVNRIKNAVDVPSGPPSKTTKECPLCTTTISIRAKRCPQCTADLVASS
jgi:large conductance mechanosensitive channel